MCSQIRIAEGYDFVEIGIPEQDEIPCKGTAIQCHVIQKILRTTLCQILVKS